MGQGTYCHDWREKYSKDRLSKLSNLKMLVNRTPKPVSRRNHPGSRSSKVTKRCLMLYIISNSVCGTGHCKR